MIIRCLFLLVLLNLFSCRQRQSTLSGLKDSENQPKENIIVVTDTEGMKESVQARIADGSLKLLKNSDGSEYLDFGAKAVGARFLFGGDVGGRGPYALWIRDMFMDLKKRYPERVDLLAGNHDDGRLAVLGGLEQTEFRNDLELLNRQFDLKGPRDQSESKLADYVVEWFGGLGLQSSLDNLSLIHI